jgi:hypothetical protein
MIKKKQRVQGNAFFLSGSNIEYWISIEGNHLHFS